jgi:mono/diheme cytochrome c family protein
MIRKLALIAVLAAIAGGLVFYLLTAPDRLSAEEVASFPAGDAGRGEMVFWTGGCSSCHAADKADGEDRLKLGGGLVLKTPFGSFTVPNISPNAEDGIGAWGLAEFAGAMLRGVSPEGAHYYPAFPYSSYTRMRAADVADLWAFMQTLPSVEGKVPGHDLSFPYNIRRGLGLWKLLFLDGDPVVALETEDPQVSRGQYIVEGPGHCGECHTPRNLAGGPALTKWLSGGPAPDGPGKIPNLTGGEGGIGSWSATDIAYYLETGFTPDFDSVGGSMVDVQKNMAMLPASDREAIAAYLKSIPAVDSAK